MSRRLLVAAFTREEDLLGAVRAGRALGLSFADIHTPYAVHGLDEAAGLASSRLSRVCLAGGILGVALAFWLQFWTSAVDWPVNVGGRPWNSWPAFLPVAFELMVLFAGFSVVFAFFFVSGLLPGKRAVLPIQASIIDRFVIVLEERDASFDIATVRRLFEQHQAVFIEESEESTPAHRGWSLCAVNWALGAALAAMVILNFVLPSDPGRPNYEFLPEMVRAIPFESYSQHPSLSGGNTMQPPSPGTIARGQMPLHFGPGKDEAVRAGAELKNPLVGDVSRWQARGAVVYANHCQVCHGADGKGNGPASSRGVPPPPSLLEKNAELMKDGQMFHVLTYGQGNMASYAGQLDRADRWAVILHIRALQKQGRTP